MISKSKRIIAGVLSAILPGTGHLFTGRKRAGIGWLTAFVAFLVLSCIARLWTDYYLLIASVWLLMLFSFIAAYDASFRPKSENGPRRLWLFLLVPLVFIPTQLMTVGWRLGGCQLYTVPSTSMQPTITMGDRIVVDSHYFRNHSVEHRQILVFKKEGLFIVKRVEAVPGDVIEGKAGTFYLNGREFDEGFEKPTEYSTAQFLATFGPIKVPPGEYFVLGDNRPVSRDSRQPGYGNIATADIVGRVLYVFNPFEASHYKNLRNTPIP